MKKLLLVLLSLIISFSSWSQVEPETEIIELPIEMINGVIPFNPSFSGIQLKDVISKSPWSGIRVDVTGVPDEWANAVVQPIWFDPFQMVYQNYKQGNLDEFFFNMIKDRWKMNMDKLDLSSEPIKCFSHIVLTKLDDGSVLYKVDTDNDRDFSDEQVFEPYKTTKSLSEIDSLSKQCHWLKGEIFVDGKIEQVKFPYYVKQDDRGLWANSPHYAQTNFKGKILVISSGFEPIFRNKSDLLIIDPNTENNPNKIIEVSEYLNIAGELYQNLGVDFGREVLRLKKIESNKSNLYGTQVGLSAFPFSGTEFSTEKNIELKDYKGKLLFLEFWGSWCGPCIHEIPKLKKVYEQLDKNKISFLGIAQDNPKSLKKCIDKNEIPWGHILSDKDNNIVQQYNINSFPSSFLIDEKGVIIAKDLRSERLLEAIEQHLIEHNKN